MAGVNSKVGALDYQLYYDFIHLYTSLRKKQLLMHIREMSSDFTLHSEIELIRIAKRYFDDALRFILNGGEKNVIRDKLDLMANTINSFDEKLIHFVGDYVRHKTKCAECNNRHNESLNVSKFAKFNIYIREVMVNLKLDRRLYKLSLSPTGIDDDQSATIRYDDSDEDVSSIQIKSCYVDMECEETEERSDNNNDILVTASEYTAPEVRVAYYQFMHLGILLKQRVSESKLHNDRLELNKLFTIKHFYEIIHLWVNGRWSDQKKLLKLLKLMFSIMSQLQHPIDFGSVDYLDHKKVCNVCPTDTVTYARVMEIIFHLMYYFENMKKYRRLDEQLQGKADEEESEIEKLRSWIQRHNFNTKP